MTLVVDAVDPASPPAGKIGVDLGLAGIRCAGSYHSPQRRCPPLTAVRTGPPPRTADPPESLPTARRQEPRTPRTERIPGPHGLPDVSQVPPKPRTPRPPRRKTDERCHSERPQLSPGQVISGGRVEAPDAPPARRESPSRHLTGVECQVLAVAVCGSSLAIRLMVS